MRQSYPAYAKINIGLLILEKRPDGYHNIETIFHKIDLYDVIEFSVAPTIRVSSSTAEAPSNESNICFKAAKLLQDHLNVKEGVHISISKNIPVGAGLGGGSSDAATVLRHLPTFWRQVVDQRTLEQFALQLGSDVPFFLGNSSALGCGRGEQLEYFHLDLPYEILLCNPNIHVSTAWAYKNVVPRKPTGRQNLKQIVQNALADPKNSASELRNDFEQSVFREYPEIAHVKDVMLGGGAVFASMSGSGSSVFGLFAQRELADTVARQLSAHGYRTYLTQRHFSI